MLKRLSTLVGDFVSLFGGEGPRPESDALIEAAKEDLNKQIAKYNQDLATHADVCDRLNGSLKVLEEQERLLREATREKVQQGDRPAAKLLALQLRTVQQQIDDHRHRLADAEVIRQDLIGLRDTAVQSAQAQLEALRQRLDNPKAFPGVTGFSGLNLPAHPEHSSARLRQLSEIPSDRTPTATGLTAEAEQNYLADQALSEFLARERLALPEETAPGGSIERHQPPGANQPPQET